MMGLKRALAGVVLALTAALVMGTCHGSSPGTAARPPSIVYPLDGTIFPPDIAPPTFRWETGAEGVESWAVAVKGASSKVTAQTKASRWTPSDQEWATIREMSRDKNVTFTVRDAGAAEPEAQAASISILTSSDEVGAPLFYREVNLPFIDAIRDSTKIRWRFGEVSSTEPPPIVLEKLPVCGNCHSFSADGSIIGMDVDYANDKGSYIVTGVAQEILLERQKIITWSDYRRDEGIQTFGLLSQVSPDGRYVASTVQDRSVFVPMPDLAFSQLFFPVQGIVVIYDRQEKAFNPLPGANDPQYVQSNPTWSPDGQHIVFAKSKAHKLPAADNMQSVLLGREAAREFAEEGKIFRFDLYRVPVNGGEGGPAEPLKGASHNGMSNYFPRYSPDGRWIVFCKAKSYMLLQPDSELYIMPAAGGEPRRMRCNTKRMNSWHSWSPNGRWLVFSAKPDSAYTQLMLTHIDDEGRSSPPVHLDRMVASKRAANIPEFVNAEPTAIKRINEEFIDEVSLMRAGNEALKANDLEGAERSFRKSLELNPNYIGALNNLGFLLMKTGRGREAKGLFERAVKVQPDEEGANNNLSIILMKAKQFDQAAELLTKYVELRPDDAAALCNLGSAWHKLGRREKARDAFEKSLRINSKSATAHCNLSKVLHELGYDEDAFYHLDLCRHLLEQEKAPRR